MEELDRWMLSLTFKLVEECREWYKSFEFHRVFHALHDFAVVDLSAFYFDVLKDRLYTFAPRNRARRSAQTAVYRIAKILLTLLTPITVFTAEEIWKYFPRVEGDPDSAHLLLFASVDFDITQEEKIVWALLMGLRERVLKELEEARKAKLISGSLEAKIILDVSLASEQLLKRYEKWLRPLFIVSQVEIVTGLGPHDGVRVMRADGTKCERCWNYSTHVGENADYPTVCERCVKALHEIEHESGASGLGAAS
jgi:isoleucyl-tRNA synthetase